MVNLKHWLIGVAIGLAASAASAAAVVNGKSTHARDNVDPGEEKQCG